MAVKLIPIKCPECGAMLNIEENRTQAFCSYCGAKVLVHNDNEFTYRHVDIADLERAETDRLIRLKELELYEQKRAARERGRKKVVKVLAYLGIGGIIFVSLGFLFMGLFGNLNPIAGVFTAIGGMMIMPVPYIAIYLLISGIMHSSEDKKMMGR